MLVQISGPSHASWNAPSNFWAIPCQLACSLKFLTHPLPAGMFIQNSEPCHANSVISDVVHAGSGPDRLLKRCPFTFNTRFIDLFDHAQPRSMGIKIADMSPQFIAFGAESASGPLLDSHNMGSGSGPGARPRARKTSDRSAILVRHRASRA